MGRSEAGLLATVTATQMTRETSPFGRARLIPRFGQEETGTKINSFCSFFQLPRRAPQMDDLGEILRVLLLTLPGVPLLQAGAGAPLPLDKEVMVREQALQPSSAPP